MEVLPLDHGNPNCYKLVSMVETSIKISKDGEDWKPLILEPSGALDIAQERDFTLVDKYGQHLVFVDWITKEWITLDSPDVLDEYIVGKDYTIKIPFQ